MPIPLPNPKLYPLKEIIDTNKVGGYKVRDAGGRWVLDLYTSDEKVIPYEFLNGETLAEVNEAVAYVRQRTL